MARIRYIKSEFWKDEDIAELSHQLRLFYIGLWNFADKDGRLGDRPKWLKAEIFPYENADTEKMLKTLANPKSNSGNPFIQRYAVAGKKYLQILAWHDHQKPHHQEPNSNIPKPPPLTLTLTETETITITESVLQADLLTQSENLRTITESTVIKEVISDFNEIFKTSYKDSTVKTRSLIKSRLKEGFTVEDFKRVHRRMADKWGPDNKMRGFLRPATLYSDKFESYLNMPEDLKVSEKIARTIKTAEEWIKRKDKEENEAIGQTDKTAIH